MLQLLMTEKQMSWSEFSRLQTVAQVRQKSTTGSVLSIGERLGTSAVGMIDQ